MPSQATLVMNSRKSEGGIDAGSHISEDYIKPPFPPTDFYVRILNDPEHTAFLREHYGRDFDPRDIVHHEPYELFSQGYEGRGRHNRIVLKEMGGRYSPLQIFLKMAREGDEGKKVSMRERMPLADSMVYQAEHLKYWNKLGSFPSPRFFGIEEHTFDLRKVFWLGVEYWGGYLHDANLLALQNAEKILNERGINGSAVNLGEARARMKAERKNIISTSLDSLLLMHLMGSGALEEYKTSHDGFSLYELKNPEEFFLEDRAKHYFRTLLKYRLKSKSRKMGVLPYDGGDIDGLVMRFAEIIQPLLTTLYDKQRYCYTHGDAYPHNFMFRDKGENRKTGVLDSEHTMMGPPGYDFAKFLTSFIAGLDIDEETADIVRIFKSGGYGVNERQFVHDYFMAAFATRLFDMGKRAFNGLEEKERGFSFIRGRQGSLAYDGRESGVLFPIQGHVDTKVNYPDVDETLKTQGNLLSRRISQINNPPFSEYLDRWEREGIQALGKFLAQYRVIEA